MMQTSTDEAFERAVAKFGCPYHPERGLRFEANDKTLVCDECRRRFPWEGRCFDLRPDDLRSNASEWVPGDPGWDDRHLWLIGANSKRRPDGTIDVASDVLDIGCGATPAGSFNLDAYVPEPVPPNFVLATADLLPFKAKTFDCVVSRYVIEHVTDPVHFVRECVRLARREITIVTDNADWLGEIAFRIAGRGRIFHAEHVYKWSVEYLRNLLQRFDGIEATVELDTLSDTPIVRLVARAARGPILGPLLHRDLVARIVVR
jgi:SAM-dependent methyltransferase